MKDDDGSDDDMNNFSDIIGHSSVSSTVSQKSTSVSISKSVTDKEPIRVVALVNVYTYKGKGYVGMLSGLLFDMGLNDSTLTSSQVVEMFVSKYDSSIHKVCLPIPKGEVNYRKNFLVNAGFDTSANLEDLTYPRCISHNPVTGSIDIANLSIGSDKILRRFPAYFINVDSRTSNAPEFSLDIALKMEELVDALKAVRFMFSVRQGSLKGREFVYDFHKSVVDVTDHKETKEYRQMRLLVGCAAAIKAKQSSRFATVESSPLKKEADSQESSVPVTPKATYKGNMQPVTPTVSAEVSMISNMHVGSDKETTPEGGSEPTPEGQITENNVTASTPIVEKNNRKRKV